MSVLLLFSGATLGLWLRGFLGSSSRSGVNQVSLRSIFSGAPIVYLCCTRYVQIVGIVTSLMNGNMEIHHQKPHEIEVRHDQLLGLEPEPLIMYDIVSDQDRSL